MTISKSCFSINFRLGGNLIDAIFVDSSNAPSPITVVETGTIYSPDLPLGNFINVDLSEENRTPSIEQ
jgi:hypothetical protein